MYQPCNFIGQSVSSTGTVRVVLGASDGVDGTYPGESLFIIAHVFLLN